MRLDPRFMQDLVDAIRDIRDELQRLNDHLDVAKRKTGKAKTKRKKTRL